jgi:hypothetical protein
MKTEVERCGRSLRVIAGIVEGCQSAREQQGDRCHCRKIVVASGTREDAMMKLRGAVLLCVFLLPLAACLPVLSLHRWYTDKDVVTDPALPGTWYMIDGGKPDTSTTLTITKDESDGYVLSVNEKDHADLTDKWKLVVFRLGDRRYVDESEREIDARGKDIGYGDLKLPVHMVGTIEIAKDDIVMNVLDDDWLNNALKADPNFIHYERAGDNSLLIAGTAELQKLIAKGVTDPKAFSQTTELQRSK